MIPRIKSNNDNFLIREEYPLQNSQFHPLNRSNTSRLGLNQTFFHQTLTFRLTQIPLNSIGSFEKWNAKAQMPSKQKSLNDEFVDANIPYGQNRPPKLRMFIYWEFNTNFIALYHLSFRI